MGYCSAKVGIQVGKYKKAIPFTEATNAFIRCENFRGLNVNFDFDLQLGNCS